MQLEPYVNTLGRHLKSRFGTRVRKLSLHAGFTCPNRDGTLGRGGCTFCSVLSFSEDKAEESVSAQIAARRAELKRATRYLAYFQAYTNTYAEVEELRRLYAAAVVDADIVGLCVGTRPDCVPDAVLEILADYRAQGFEVWLELGLQSAHDATLARINRGHGFAAYADAVARAQRYDVPVCAHLILGLPGETTAMMHETHARVLALGVEGLKLHPLMIVKGCRMAAEYARGETLPPTLPDYAAIAADLIRRTPPEVVFHRITATAREPTLIAPDWCYTSFPAANAIAVNLAAYGGQGRALR
ncbi:TIGR01212 family radical SAM protein [Rhodocyclus tenuis]|uniref:TIGR01212 family radical SAM protein n=2 Tax=Rhodocyclus TaxID=1064 RepID=A0A6L5JWE9_RHOTE|nr:TIGR01212 family radical SAM protein [Rhodocyclus gracilis]MRD72512.1 TIGR01212 family radical SAM protein [Rhodocyclus gracilis]NJA88022.1 TIGR01212 family radical SAM protein [Rhodocyclus gracilis]